MAYAIIASTPYSDRSEAFMDREALETLRAPSQLTFRDFKPYHFSQRFDSQSQSLFVRQLIVKPIWGKRAAPIQVIFGQC